MFVTTFISLLLWRPHQHRLFVFLLCYRNHFNFCQLIAIASRLLICIWKSTNSVHSVGTGTKHTYLIISKFFPNTSTAFKKHIWMQLNKPSALTLTRTWGNGLDMAVYLRIKSFQLNKKGNSVNLPLVFFFSTAKLNTHILCSWISLIPLIIPVLNCNLEQRHCGGGQGAWLSLSLSLGYTESLGKERGSLWTGFGYSHYTGISMLRTAFKGLTTDTN